MKTDIEKEFSEKAEIFKALGHPTSLFIIHAVADKKMSVKELTVPCVLDFMSCADNEINRK